MIYLNVQPTQSRRIMKAILLTLLLTCATAFSQTPEKANTNSAATDKAFVLTIEVPAPRAAVWHAFATSDGLSTWLTPGAVVDLRPGGEWTAHFPDGKTGGGTIVSFVPEQEIVISAMAPEQFPTVRANRTRARFHFGSRGDYTLVQLEQTGWQSGEEWDKAYEYLFAGNAELLATLHHRFINGPIDWEKVWGTPKK
jgi:uncharacterized protein YndB with AHSA1/START domain